MAANYCEKKIYDIGEIKCTILDVMKEAKISKSGAYQRLLKFMQGKISASDVFCINGFRKPGNPLNKAEWGDLTNTDRSGDLDNMPSPTKYDEELRLQPMFTSSHE